MTKERDKSKSPGRERKAEGNKESSQRKMARGSGKKAAEGMKSEKLHCYILPVVNY